MKNKFLSTLNGVAVGLILWFSTLFGIVVCQFPWLVLVRPFSEKYWRVISTYTGDFWYRMVLFIIEKWNGVEVRVTGDHLPEREFALLLCNHPSEADWFFTWSLALRKKSLGNVKVAMKKEIQVVPGLGWAIDNLDFIYLSRKWELDEPQIKHSLNGFLKNDTRLWMLVFPEGTDFTEAKQKKSWELAEINGWPKYKHLLAPRTKGFTCIYNVLKPHLDAVYDVTVSYGREKATMWTALSGTAPTKVSMHVRRILIKDIPEGDEQLKKWLFDTFSHKDSLLDYFYQNGRYPNDPIPPPSPLGSDYNGMPIFVAFLLWMVIIFGSIYAIFYVPYAWILWASGALTFVTFAHSKKARIWGGMDPPLEGKQKKT
eukprot:TRINITY_DN2559_c0_g1_i1.p1 TRINITY_DN2559_c0_g1~~TRINITY_DN2559_c0_g1_i1.p1  ORF type:complete len:371 (-),score=63.23 TRINITY_DN2559_c0_g1_i1:59-1171(-)